MYIEAEYWSLAPFDGNRWPNFTAREFAQRGPGWVEGETPIKMDENFLDWLQALRMVLGFPFPISSGYRSPEYNMLISKSGEDGPHTTGRAADILCYGERAYAILSKAPSFGFTGIGIKQKGPIKSRFIHLDRDIRDKPTIWSY